MKLHFLAIVNQIKAKVPEIKTIDLYNAQYLKQAEELPFTTPAVFIEFGELPWLNQGDGTQECPDAVLTLHVVDDDYEDTWQSNLANINQNPTLKWIELVEKIHKAFNNYALKALYLPPTAAQLPSDAPVGSVAPVAQDVWLSTDMQRSSQVTDTDAYHLRVEKLSYSTNLYDYSATSFYDYIQVPVEPEVSVIV